MRCPPIPPFRTVCYFSEILNEVVLLIDVLMGIFGELAGGRLIWTRAFGIFSGIRLFDDFRYRSMFVWFKLIEQERVIGSVIVH